MLSALILIYRILRIPVALIILCATVLLTAQSGSPVPIILGIVGSAALFGSSWRGLGSAIGPLFSRKAARATRGLRVGAGFVADFSHSLELDAHAPDLSDTEREAVVRQLIASGRVTPRRELPTWTEEDDFRRATFIRIGDVLVAIDRTEDGVRTVTEWGSDPDLWPSSKPLTAKQITRAVRKARAELDNPAQRRRVQRRHPATNGALIVAGLVVLGIAIYVLL